MNTTEFMLQLGKQLMDARKVTESTSNAYIKSLYALNEKKPFKNLTFLKQTDKIEELIAGYAETTQRALLASIVSVLALYKDKPAFKKTYNHYYEKMMERSKEARATEDNGEKTEKQKDNWISWEDIEKRKTELFQDIGSFITKKTIDTTQYERLLQFVVLALYTEVQPRRNQDYLDMYIVKKWNDKMPTDKNYIDIASKKFIYNKYKTSRKYGMQSIEIPENLWTALQIYLKFHPLWKGVAKRKTEPVKFLVYADGSPLTAVNAITRLLNKVFGKKIGSSMIRHIYISDKYKNVMEEQKADAEAMGHSVSQQRDYYKKDDKADE
jgi:integrase